MEAIKALSDEYGFSIIEDASHALGGRYKDSPIGDCRYSDMTVFSFHPVKIITTAEGGAVTTNSDELAEKLALFRSHGVTREESLMTQRSHGPWYYEQIELGYNYRMTDVQAALGSSQMKLLDANVSRRHEIAERYDSKLAELPLQLPFRETFSYSAFHLYVVLVDSARTAERQAIFESLRSQGIGVNVHYIPVHLQPYHRASGFDVGDFPCAEDYYSRAISIPMYASLTDEQQDQVVGALETALS